MDITDTHKQSWCPKGVSRPCFVCDTHHALWQYLCTRHNNVGQWQTYIGDRPSIIVGSTWSILFQSHAKHLKYWCKYNLQIRVHAILSTVVWNNMQVERTNTNPSWRVLVVNSFQLTVRLFTLDTPIYDVMQKSTYQDVIINVNKDKHVASSDRCVQPPTNVSKPSSAKKA